MRCPVDVTSNNRCSMEVIKLCRRRHQWSTAHLQRTEGSPASPLGLCVTSTGRPHAIRNVRSSGCRSISLIASRPPCIIEEGDTQWGWSVHP